MPPFKLFGCAHIATLLLVALATVLAAVLYRNAPNGRTRSIVRASLVVSLVALVAFQYSRAAIEGWLSAELLPLHLCDAAVVLAVISLTTGNRSAAELLYFWAGAGTSLAILTPDLSMGFPRWEFLLYFAHHGLVIVSSAVLTFGMGLTPRPGAVRRVFLVTNAYVMIAALVNALLGTNFLYLRHKPEPPTLLDAFGPWPFYLVVCEAAALTLFFLLKLPFRSRVGTPALLKKS
jgi:hypothetical integral membrane protein (TIGR02206 family)